MGQNSHSAGAPFSETPTNLTAANSVESWSDFRDCSPRLIWLSRYFRLKYALLSSRAWGSGVRTLPWSQPLALAIGNLSVLGRRNQSSGNWWGWGSLTPNELYPAFLPIHSGEKLPISDWDLSPSNQRSLHRDLKVPNQNMGPLYWVKLPFSLPCDPQATLYPPESKLWCACGES